jgi:DNA polymerase-3 subunit alpha (Gram-positive type)
MEKVRKGKGVSKEHEELMLKYEVPAWYVESCKLIKYMFPKAHATAYVIMALRIGWFKVYRPIYYYAGFFSRRASAFDVEAMAHGFESIKSKLVELDSKIKNRSASAKEEDTFAALLLAIEMVARGMKFKQMNIHESEAINFKVLEDKETLLIPFGALDSLGPSIAHSIVAARNEHPFTSKQDVMRRTKLNATQFEKMNSMGVFDGLPEDDQIGLFS